jgi:hypothetical protein
VRATELREGGSERSEINSGRAWLWGEVLAWFKDTGRA